MRIITPIVILSETKYLFDFEILHFVLCLITRNFYNKVRKPSLTLGQNDNEVRKAAGFALAQNDREGRDILNALIQMFKFSSLNNGLSKN